MNIYTVIGKSQIQKSFLRLGPKESKWCEIPVTVTAEDAGPLQHREAKKSGLPGAMRRTAWLFGG